MPDTPSWLPQSPDARRLARIRAVVDGYKQQGATPAEIQELIRDHHPELVATQASEMAAMPRTTAENVQGGLLAGLQGATFNFADEIAGAIDPSRTAGDYRQDLAGFREAHPKTALGLELAGGLASGLGTARAAVGGLSAARAIPRIAATGAGGGALAGIGSGETAGQRAELGVLGAALGFGLGEVGETIATSRLGDAAGRVGRRVMDTAADQGQPALTPFVPQAASNVPAARAVARALGGQDGDFSGPRRSLMDAVESGMGEDVLAVNLGGDNAARAARAVANAPVVPFSGTNPNEILNQALARQGGALGRGVATDIGVATGMGGEPGPIALRRMQQELSDKVQPMYDAFRALPEVPLDPNDEAQRLFIEEYVQPIIANKRMTGTLTSGSALSGEVVDEAFKDLQRAVRGAETAVNMGNSTPNVSGRLRAMRDRVSAAIGQTDPAYAQARTTYALDEDVGKVVQDAFGAGMGMRKAPVGTFTVESGRLPEQGQKAMRAGLATSYQQGAGDVASNADFDDLTKFRDVARGVVGSENDATRFKEAFGDGAYEVLMTRLSPKVRAAAMNAAIRGNSTTTRQLLDAMQMGDAAVLDVLGNAVSGGATGMLSAIGRQVSGVLPALRQGTIGESANEAAKMFTTRGVPANAKLLDMLERVAREDLSRQATARVGAGATNRTLLDRLP